MRKLLSCTIRKSLPLLFADSAKDILVQLTGVPYAHRPRDFTMIGHPRNHGIMTEFPP